MLALQISRTSASNDDKFVSASYSREVQRATMNKSLLQLNQDLRCSSKQEVLENKNLTSATVIVAAE